MRLVQVVGISDSGSRYFTGSGTGAILSAKLAGWLGVEADAPVEACWGVDVQHPHRDFPVIAEGVLDARGNQHECAGWRRDVLALDHERHLAFEDVKRIVF